MYVQKLLCLPELAKHGLSIHRLPVLVKEPEFCDLRPCSTRNSRPSTDLIQIKSDDLTPQIAQADSPRRTRGHSHARACH